MPVFPASDVENQPFRMEGWDDDEAVHLKSYLTWLDEQRAKSKAVVWPDNMSHEQLRKLPQAQLERLLAECTDPSRVEEELLVSMIESWTLRRGPTRAQAEKGARGDIMPLTRDTIRKLPPAVGGALRAEIERRRDVVTPEQLTGPRGDDFRHADDVPGKERLPGEGEPDRAADGAGVPDSGENGLVGGPARRRAARTT